MTCCPLQAEVSRVKQVDEKRLLTALTTLRQNNDSLFRVDLVTVDLNIWLLHMFEGNIWKDKLAIRNRMGQW